MSTLTTRRKGRRAAIPLALRGPSSAPTIAAKHPSDIQALPAPDWIGQTVTFSGQPEQIATLKAQAKGSGLVPWIIDYDQREEIFFLWLASPHNGRRGMTVKAAHILAKQLRDAEWQMHEMASARSSLSTACPFDLHALIPVPGPILRLGPDDPAAMRWMWRHWGTTWTLRRVDYVQTEHSGPGQFSVGFFSADWTPWPVLATLKARFGVDWRVTIAPA